MEDNPKVSVIIPVYNMEKYLSECIDSVLRQSLSDMEIICIDDGSTDGSAQILEEYREKDRRIKVIHRKNGGLSAARNTGIANARGEYIYFLDSDDYIDPTAMEFLSNEMDKNRLDVLFFDADSFYESENLEEKFPSFKTNYTYKRSTALDGIYTGQEILSLFRKINGYRVSAPMQMFRKDHLVNNKLSFYEGILYEDNLFTFQSLLAAKRASHRNCVLYHRRVRENSITTAPSDSRNFWGYFICYEQMTASFLQAQVDPMYTDDLIGTIDNVKELTLSSYEYLVSHNTDVDLSSLNKIESEILNRMLLGNECANEFISPTGGLTLIGKYKKELESMRTSTSYRIGRFITFIPRKMQGVMRCYREHGLAYTVKVTFRKQ